VRDVDEGALVEPLALDDHLNDVHHRLGLREETLVGRNVDHTLEDSDRLIKHRLGVRDEVGDRQRAPFEVSLEQEVGLHVRALELVLGDLDRDQVRQSLVEDILVVPDGKPCELLGVRQDGQELIDRLVAVNFLAEHLDCLMAEIIEGGQVTEGRRSNDLVLPVVLDALGPEQLLEGLRDELP